MKYRSLAALGAVVAALALAGCSSSGQTPAKESAAPDESQAATQAAPAEVQDATLTVFAAASLKETFTEMEAIFEEANPGVDVVLDLQGSQDLVAALEAGAPADVLATANTSTMEKAQGGDLVEEPAVFATNVLTLIVPDGNPAGVTGLDASLDGKKLVICAPEVPCGKATKKLTEALGVSLTPVSEEQKVTDVRGKVASGEADAGIVYRTDANAEKDRTDEVPIVGTEQATNTYPIAVVKNAPNPELAKKWVELVLSDQGQSILSNAGFGPGK